MPRAARAARCKRKLTGPRLRKRNEILDAARGDRRMNDEHIRHLRNERNRREVLHRIERKPAIQRHVNRVSTYSTHQDGVTVRRGLGDRIRADIAACTGAVVDDYRLIPALAEVLPDRPRDDVEGSAWGKRHDIAYYFSWVSG